MAKKTNILLFFCVVSANTLVSNEILNDSEIKRKEISDEVEADPSDVFSGVYTECLLSLSYTCLQYKTLMYLKHLENTSDISVIGDYVRFVKLNGTSEEPVEDTSSATSEDLSLLIDRTVDKFFDNHILKIAALGKDITIPSTGEEFVGRKKRKGGGGGGHDHDDGGKKKMMMMAMMCMKMKFMMMVPAMMGMMGMMSFKGMMFSMMSFMVSKMMLIMKLLEKKSAIIGGGGDAGWSAAAAGGGGAWMPAGGQDFGGGGYDANGQWQSRSILEQSKAENEHTLPNKPISSYVTPVRYDRNLNNIKSYSIFKNSNNDETKAKQKGSKSRRKRGIVDMLQNAYVYWLGKVFGAKTKKNNIYYPKYRIVNGVKYIFYPLRQIQKTKAVKALDNLKNEEISKQTVTADFNKGEIVEGALEIPVESRMSRKKFHKMKDLMNDTIEQSPWQ